MKKSITIILSLFFAGLGFPQIQNVSEKLALPEQLQNASGTIFFNNQLVVIDDHGSQNKLYELDTISGQITRSVTIANATNKNWEDLAQDDDYIYIGDIGNNYGHRKDLKIYKINKEEYLLSESVTAEFIDFDYANQHRFGTALNATEWDAEALISYDSENLMVFTKNWVNGKTQAYLIPKEAGNYSVEPMHTTLDSEALISGASFDADAKKLYLIGYNILLFPYLWICEDFDTNDIFSGTNTKIEFSTLGIEQIEGIAAVDEHRFLMVSETLDITGISEYGKLIAFDVGVENNLAIINYKKTDIMAYPNPVSDLLFIEGEEIYSIDLFNMQGERLLQTHHSPINVTHMPKGMYFVKIKYGQDQEKLQKILIQ